MNVLFIGIRYRSINPTPGLVLVALGSTCHVHFYGPGYVREDVLNRGAAAYADGLPHIDLVVAGNDIASDIEAPRLNRFIARYGVSTQRPYVSEAALADMRGFLQRHRSKVVVSLLDRDVYAIQQRTLDHLLACGEYFMGWGEDGLDFSGESGDIEVEPYIRNVRAQGLEVGLYAQFAKRYRHRIVNIGFFVGDGDFSWGHIASRKYDVVVPGAPYHRRGVAIGVLKERGEVAIGTSRVPFVFKVANRLGLRPWSRYYPLHLYNQSFHRLLSQSKAGVTEGGLINFTIRKFFEIPAAGAVLVCWPTPELIQGGFQHDVNCLFVSNPQDMVEAARAVAAAPDLFQRHATAGQQLVLHKHSTHARGRQMRQAFELIRAGTFAGSHWSDGDFVCEITASALGPEAATA